MDPCSNLVAGNISLELSSFFQEGGHPTVEPMVEVRILVSMSRIPSPGRIAQVESQPDVFSFLLPLSDLFPDQLRRLQVEHMLSHIGHPLRSDIDFWTEEISSYALHAAAAVVFPICSGLSMVVDLNISMVWPTDFGESEPVIDVESRFSLEEAAGEDFGEAEPLIDEEFLVALEGAAGEDFGEAEPRVIDEELLLSMTEPVGTEGREFGAVPASKSSIQALEKKRYRGDDGKDGSTCAVCLEDFKAGDELTVMPCSHEFHQSCATKWLERSNICPLCRYAMPTFD